LSARAVARAVLGAFAVLALQLGEELGGAELRFIGGHEGASLRESRRYPP
jgi:hypothetical protein